METLKNRQHLFFDLDDTLWDFEKNSSIVLSELFIEFKLKQKIKTDFLDFYSAYKNINQHLWTQYRKKQIDKDFLRSSRFHLSLKFFDHDDFDESLLLNEQYLQRAPKGKLLKDGCLETLEYLAEKHTLHIITNGFKEIQHIKIDGCGLRDYFSNIIISEEHSLTKPDEKIFRLAETFANTDRESCVMIGDNFDCDIKGANDAGWASIYFSENEHHYSGHAIKSLAELKLLF